MTQRRFCTHLVLNTGFFPTDRSTHRTSLICGKGIAGHSEMIFSVRKGCAGHLQIAILFQSWALSIAILRPTKALECLTWTTQHTALLEGRPQRRGASFEHILLQRQQGVGRRKMEEEGNQKNQLDKKGRWARGKDLKIREWEDVVKM